MTGGPTILIVGGEAIQGLLPLALGPPSPAWALARSGAEALALLALRPIAVAVIDGRLEDMDGFDLASRLRRAPPSRELPLLLVVPAAEATRRFDGDALGPVDVVITPVQPALLERRLGLLLRFHEQRAELLEARQRLEAVMDAAPVGISFSDDATAQRIRGNRMTHDMLHAGPEANLSASAPDESAAGRAVRFYHDGRLVEPERLPLQRAIAERQLIPPVELEVESPGGQRFWTEASAAPVRDASGTVVGGVAVMVDITARKQAERAREQLEEELRQAIVVRDRLAALVSHDLRNLLAAVATQTDALRLRLGRGALDERRLADGLERIRRNAARMDRLLGELLDITRLQAGEELRLERRELDLVELCRRLVADHAHGAPGHRLELVAGAPELRGSWDAARLERVLDNLVSNAVKYSPAGGRVTVAVTPDEGGAYAVVSVRDEGLGIPAADLPGVFEWFTRAHNTTTIPGTGLGLAGVRHIVERHGGSLGVESEEGRGSTFVVRLPLAGDAAAPCRGAR